ncbi:MAG: hypothetical protein ACI83B_002207, partial [Sediminicola sp.]
MIYVKNDLNLLKETIEYIYTLNHLTKPNFCKTKYNTGIPFNKKIITTPIRFTRYSKEFEIKGNKNFFKIYPQLADDFNNINHTLLNKVIQNQIKFKP